MDTSETGAFESENESEEEFLPQFDSESDGELNQTAISDDSLDEGSQNLLDASAGDSTEKFEFITNQIGQQKLYADGFGFHRSKTIGPKTNWQCEFHGIGCSASATTIKLTDGGSNVVRIKNDHNHLVDLDRKQKFIGR